jgi:acyl transferase domain-containing protein/acyl carrier protein
MSTADSPPLSQRVLQALDDAIARLEAVETARREPIAVIGLGCRFPGGADDADSFWKLLETGADATRTVPPGRWDADTFHAAAAPKIATTRGGFLDAIDGFDAPYFGISPREAASIDPQHRLLLEVAVEALENAGCPPDRSLERKAGVFIGITGSDYAHLLKQPADLAAIDGWFVTGNALNAAAGRLSHTLGLHGPSLAVDSACSSSLVAVHLACRSLRAGECEMALAGGVNLILAPEASVALSRAQMLAPDGRCKSFDAAADGYGRGEGCGIVVLKPLSAARRDGDPILALLRASAVNQDGTGAGFTVPNGASQQALIRQALEEAKLRPADIGYIEAHGTGTALGDPIEIGALAAALGQDRGGAPLLVGAVKTNLGHLESAAGIAGLIKVVLALQREALPPLANFQRPNPLVAWDALPVRLVTELTAWRRGGQPRRAGVSSFGISGTNAHLIVEEAPLPEPVGTEPARPHLLALSGRSDAALRELAGRWEAHLAARPDLRLGDVCCTAGAGRAHHGHRLAIVASTLSETVEKLGAFHRGMVAPGLLSGNGTREPRVAFLFSGEWADSLGAARELCAAEPLFFEAWKRCERAGEKGDERFPRFALEYALAQLWMACGVQPAAVVGQGFGECAAACVAGVLSLEDALALALGRDAAALAFSPPHTRYVSADSRASVASPEYWSRPRATATDLSTARDLGIDIVLTLTPHPALTGTLPGMHEDGPSALAFIETLAGLYVRGAAIRWEALHHRHPRRRIPLPTYPWQRQRCWFSDGAPDSSSTSRKKPGPLLGHLLAGDTARATAALETAQPWTAAERALLPRMLDALLAEDRRQLSGGAVDDWFYEPQWQIAPSLRHSAAQTFPPPGRLAQRLGEVAGRWSNPAYSETLRRLEEWAPALIGRAFEELGWRFEPRQRFTTEEAAERLGVAAGQRRLLGRLLGILEEAGCVRRSGAGWATRHAPKANGAPTAAGLLARCPEAVAEITLLERCGASLAAVLRGACDPLQLLFPPDPAALSAARLYRDAPVARAMNALVREAVAAALERLPRDRAVRILEIGGGTGATTRELLPLLPPERAEYFFTDISPSFTAMAREQFSGFPFVRCEPLDIERDPATQGFEPGRCDIVVAANVLHATADLRAALRHVRSLLAPGGLLVLLEATGRLRTVDLIFGLTEGWWRFADHDLRPAHPLLSTPRWKLLLAETGFDEVAATSLPGAENGDPASRQTVLVAHADRSAPAPAATGGGRWIIFADRSGSAGELAEALRRRGESVSLVAPGVGFACAADDAFQIAADQPADFEQLFALHRSEPVKGIVSLWPLDAGAEPADDAEAACRSHLHLVQSLLAAGFPSTPALTLVTRGATTGAGLAQAGVWGIGATLALEHPECAAALLDLDPERQPGEAEAITAELFAGAGREPQVAFRGQERRVARLARSTPAARAPIAFRPDGCYLITGGLGGLGLLVVEWMVARGAVHLVLAARSRPDASAEAALQRLAQAGAQVTLAQTDIAERDAVERLLAEIAASGQPLRGVIHAAGVLDDGLLLQLSWERFRRVLRPKVAGAWHLHTLTAGAPLDFFVLFSSATALLGSPGQANHVAANAFLDALAHHRRARGLPALSVNWGPWSDAGAAARRALAARAAMKGIGMIPPAQGLEALDRLLAADTAQAGVVPIAWDQVPAATLARPFFSAFARGAAPAAAAAPRTDFRLALRSAPPAERTALARQCVAAHVAETLRLDPSTRIDPDEGLAGFGMDSLATMDLRNRLQSSLAIELPASLVFNHPTVASLAGFLLARLCPEAPAPPAPETAAAELDQLSESELGALLDAELESLQPLPGR